MTLIQPVQNRVNLRSRHKQREQNPDDLPKELQHGRRYLNRADGYTVVRVNQGQCYVTNRDDEKLTTILGSCISACIRDTRLKIGGMNHFMLPASENGVWEGAAVRNSAGTQLRYGNFAMDQLINSLMKKGSVRDDLEVKIFGGGNVLSGVSNVGHNNAKFIEDYLKNEGLNVAAKDLRGDNPRKIEYFPTTGKVRMLKLTGIHNRKMAEEEEVRLNKTRYIKDEGGSIEVWD